MGLAMQRLTLLLPCFLAVPLQAVAQAVESAAPTISIGVIKDQAEGAATRLLAKYGESLSANERIVSPNEITGDRGLFLVLSREFKVDVADKGKFGGVLFRYGVKRYSFGWGPDKEVPTLNTIQPDRWMHVVPMYFGFEADRNLKNKDVLLEMGYIPVLPTEKASCFKIGLNPIFGLMAQLGHKTRSPEPTAAGKAPEPSGSLRRLKAQGKLEFPLRCLLRTPMAPEGTSVDYLGTLFSDIGTWQLVADSTFWRDFGEARSYRRHELMLRIPSGAAFIDLKREIGASPTNFDTGAKYGANLTMQF